MTIDQGEQIFQFAFPHVNSFAISTNKMKGNTVAGSAPVAGSRGVGSFV